MFFGGRRSVVIVPGGYAISDPVGIQVTELDVLHARTNVSVAACGKWPLRDTFPANGGYLDDETTLLISGGGLTGTGANDDRTLTGTITGNVFHFTPVAILGTPDRPADLNRVVGLVADSKGTGAGDSGLNPSAWGRYFRRVMGTGRVPHLGLAVGRSKTSD